MTKSTKYFFLIISINLLIAFLIFSAIIDFDFKNTIRFIYDLKMNLLFGVIGLYFIGYIIGNKLNIIKEKKGTLKIVHGILAIFLVLIVGTLIGSSVGFLEEGFPSYLKNGDLLKSLFDYYIKPMFWIMFFGFIPTLLSGIVLGYQLKKLDKNQ
ncbi:hypothetical protein ACM55G_01640 [Flavobacterium sp. LB3P122]|uniref:hypothetical protein n=1 Tax=Flavobacterium algoriphilum TaxID=3398738 RepID=UPI003A865739